MIGEIHSVYQIQIAGQYRKIRFPVAFRFILQFVAIDALCLRIEGTRELHTVVLARCK